MADPQDELPPCECFDAPTEGFNICRPCYALAELGLTREGVAALRAKAERCEHAEEVAEFQEVRADKAEKKYAGLSAYADTGDSTIDALRIQLNAAEAALAEARGLISEAADGIHDAALESELSTQEVDYPELNSICEQLTAFDQGPTTKPSRTPEGS